MDFLSNSPLSSNSPLPEIGKKETSSHSPSSKPDKKIESVFTKAALGAPEVGSSPKRPIPYSTSLPENTASITRQFSLSAPIRSSSESPTGVTDLSDSTSLKPTAPSTPIPKKTSPNIRSRTLSEPKSLSESQTLEILGSLKFFYDEPTPITPERLEFVIALDAFLTEAYGSQKAQKKYLDYVKAESNHQKFPDKFPKPKTLDLSECELSTIPRCILNKGPKIRSINLRHNQISEIPKGSFPLSLEALNLSRNAITNVPDLSEFPNLKILNLAYNDISHFSMKDRPVRMRTLYLHGNPIEPHILQFTEGVNIERKKKLN